MTERERHDFTAGELTDLRGAHAHMVTEARLAARVLFDTLSRYRGRIPVDVMHELSSDSTRLIAALDIPMVDVIRDAARVKAALSESKLDLHDSTRR